jgi:hypothetical protein
MVAFPRFGWLTWLLYPMQIARLTFNNPGSLAQRALFACFQLLARFPEGVGVAMFWRDRLLHRRPRLIEHKPIPKSNNA